MKRFWDKVNKDGPVPSHCPELGPCWIWLRGANNKGYGVFMIGKKKNMAHRFSWTLINGEIPKDDSYNGVCVLHKCDNPICLNPNHLFLGSQLDNMRDKVSKGRHGSLHGDESPRSVLNTEQVIEIKKSTESLNYLSSKYGVGIAAISKIRNGKSWKHLN